MDNIKSKLTYENINWINPVNFHLTLKFIGETNDKKIIEIDKELKKISNLTSQFDIQLSGLGVFGSSYNPKIIWCGVNKSDQLKKLASDIHNAMDTIGFLKDRQNFVPHLTLARIKNIENKNILFNLIKLYEQTFIQNEILNEIIIFESVLKKNGAEYHEIFNYRLK